MKSDLIFDKFKRLRVGGRKNERAPNKPLLALWMLGRCLMGRNRFVAYEEADGELTELLRRFGPKRETIHTEQPFWRMQNDGIWEVTRPELVKLTRKGDAHKRSLLKHRVKGGFTKEVYDVLRADPELVKRIANLLLVKYFPIALHDDILKAVLLSPLTVERCKS